MRALLIGAALIAAVATTADAQLSITASVNNTGNVVNVTALAWGNVAGSGAQPARLGSAVNAGLVQINAAPNATLSIQVPNTLTLSGPSAGLVWSASASNQFAIRQQVGGTCTNTGLVAPGVDFSTGTAQTYALTAGNNVACLGIGGVLTATAATTGSYSGSLTITVSY